MQLTIDDNFNSRVAGYRAIVIDTDVTNATTGEVKREKWQNWPRK